MLRDPLVWRGDLAEVPAGVPSDRGDPVGDPWDPDDDPVEAPFVPDAPAAAEPSDWSAASDLDRASDPVYPEAAPGPGAPSGTASGRPSGPGPAGRDPRRHLAQHPEGSPEAAFLKRENSASESCDSDRPIVRVITTAVCKTTTWTGRVRLAGRVQTLSLNSVGYPEYSRSGARCRDLRTKLCLAPTEVPVHSKGS